MPPSSMYRSSSSPNSSSRYASSPMPPPRVLAIIHREAEEAVDGVGRELPAGAVEVEVAPVRGPRQVQEVVRHAGGLQRLGQAVVVQRPDHLVAAAVDHQGRRGALARAPQRRGPRVELGAL